MNILGLMGQWARYNDLVNNDLIRIFGELGPRWEEPVGSFFKTPRGILNHLLIADILWLRRFAENGILGELVEKRLSLFPVLQYGVEAFTDWEDYKEKRKVVDQLWLDFTREFPEEFLDREVVYKTVQGKQMKITFAGVVFHLFNHQSHHRGALSQILDQWGVANDYSGLNRILGQVVDE